MKWNNGNSRSELVRDRSIKKRCSYEFELVGLKATTDWLTDSYSATTKLRIHSSEGWWSLPSLCWRVSVFMYACPIEYRGFFRLNFPRSCSNFLSPAKISFFFLHHLMSAAFIQWLKLLWSGEKKEIEKKRRTPRARREKTRPRVEK